MRIQINPKNVFGRFANWLVISVNQVILNETAVINVQLWDVQPEEVALSQQPGEDQPTPAVAQTAQSEMLYSMDFKLTQEEYDNWGSSDEHIIGICLARFGLERV